MIFSRDAITVPVINCLTSLYAGFAIFSVLGFMAELKGVAVSDVAASGQYIYYNVYIFYCPNMRWLWPKMTALNMLGVKLFIAKRKQGETPLREELWDLLSYKQIWTFS